MYPIGQVRDQIVDSYIAAADFGVQPENSQSGNLVLKEWAFHHLVNVFCWTVTHCCSSKPISTWRHKQRGGIDPRGRVQMCKMAREPV